MCQQYKKPVPRSTVGLLEANYFNEMVTVDLHQLGPNSWYLHLIDELSRFSNDVIIKSKSTDIINRYKNVSEILDQFVWYSKYSI